MPNTTDRFAREPITGERDDGPSMTAVRDDFYICERCMQKVDKRDLGQVEWHKPPEHEPLPQDITRRVSKAAAMLDNVIQERIGYDKLQSRDGTWKVIFFSTRRVVLVRGQPLYDLVKSEADEAIDLLDSGELAPDIPQARPGACDVNPTRPPATGPLPAAKKWQGERDQGEALQPTWRAPSMRKLHFPEPILLYPSGRPRQTS